MRELANFDESQGKPKIGMDFAYILEREKSANSEVDTEAF